MAPARGAATCVVVRGRLGSEREKVKAFGCGGGGVDSKVKRDAEARGKRCVMSKSKEARHPIIDNRRQGRREGRKEGSISSRTHHQHSFFSLSLSPTIALHTSIWTPFLLASTGSNVGVDSNARTVRCLVCLTRPVRGERRAWWSVSLKLKEEMKPAAEAAAHEKLPRSWPVWSGRRGKEWHFELRGVHECVHGVGKCRGKCVCLFVCLRAVTAKVERPSSSVSFFDAFELARTPYP